MLKATQYAQSVLSVEIPNIFCLYKISSNIQHILHFNSTYCSSTWTQAASQRECAPAIMMASVCGVLRQPAKGEIAALAPCILGPGVGGLAAALCGSLDRKLALNNDCCRPQLRVVGKFQTNRVLFWEERTLCAKSVGRVWWLVNYPEEQFIWDLLWLLRAADCILLYCSKGQKFWIKEETSGDDSW